MRQADHWNRNGFAERPNRPLAKTSFVIHGFETFSPLYVTYEK